MPAMLSIVRLVGIDPVKIEGDVSGKKIRLVCVLIPTKHLRHKWQVQCLIKNPGDDFTLGQLTTYETNEAEIYSEQFIENVSHTALGLHIIKEIPVGKELYLSNLNSESISVAYEIL